MTTETPPQTPFSFKDEIKTAWKVAAAKIARRLVLRCWLACT